MKPQKPYSVTFWINKAKKNSEDKCPLWCRITVDGERAEISLKESINPKDWNIEKGRVSGNDADALRINKIIDAAKSKLNEIYDKFKYEKQIISSYNMKLEFHGKLDKPVEPVTTVGFVEASKSFLVYAENEIDKTYAEGTVKNYRSTVKFIERYVKHKYGKSDIDINLIRPIFITQFKQYVTSMTNIQKCDSDGVITMKAKVQKCHQNGFVKHLERLKRIGRWAKLNEWITENPFSEVTEEKIKTSPVYLTEDEIRIIKSWSPSNSALELSRNRFIFCCYTGLSYCDIIRLSSKHITLGIDGRKWISIRRKKTGEKCLIPILNEVKEMLDYYMGLPSKYNDGLVFPHIELQAYNKNIKQIISLCGIKKNISSHNARHSFGTTICANNGVSITTCKEMMGHSNIKTTLIYYQTTPEKMSMDIRALEIKLSERMDACR